MKTSLSFTLLSITDSLAVIHTALAQSWTSQRTGIIPTVYCIKAVDENTVWAGAGSGFYLRTTDGGTNWTARVISGAARINFYSIAPLDKNTAYLMGTNTSQADGRIYMTTDGGTSWTLQYQNTGTGVLFNSIAFWDKDNGIAFGDPVEGSFLVVTTTNGGVTWKQVPAANIPSPLLAELGGFADYGGTCLAVEGTSNAWFGTGYIASGPPVRVFRTTNKGLNWTVADTPFPNSNQVHGISTIVFRDSLNGFAGGHNKTTTLSRLMQTTDGGRSWTMVTSFPPGEPSTILYVPYSANRVIVATTQSGIAGSVYSQDGGATWKSISNNALYRGLTFVNPTTGWATGNSGLIVKFNGNLSTAVVEQKSDKLLDFDLSQNYPNPFNPVTTIRYGLPQAVRVSLKIYNLLGDEVVALVNEEQKAAGYYLAIWDGRNKNGEVAANGVYIYRLHAQSFTITKKMALIR